MKKHYVFALLILAVNFVNAQIEQTSYRGAFAPAPAAMWTDSWTNWDPNATAYADEATVVNVTTDITSNTTWTTGKTYKITGLIYVRNNATLTIQPGVVVKGVFTNTGTALIVTKGAKLNAVGTPTSPIVFTSAKPAGTRAPGDWGGIVLLGKAGFNVNGGVNNIEGITASVNTEYGGGATPNDNDNSGTLKYVRIEFGGFVFSPNNEINGLTMGAVGRGTTIDYVQVSFANDDAFEWFGGSVNCKHLVAYRNLDDDFDTDNGYKGFVQYALGVKDPALADNPAVSTSEGFESDNNAAGTASGSGLDTTSAIFTNFTMVGPSGRGGTVATGHERPVRIRRVSRLKIYNSLFLDFKNNFLFVDGAATVALANSGDVKFVNNIIAGNLNSNFSGGVNPTSLNTWFTNSGNTAQASASGLLTTLYGSTPATSYSGADYRPVVTAAAATGANFTDAAIAPYVIPDTGTTPIVSDVTYCQGDLASRLTATLTGNGVSLKWYTLPTGGVASTTAPSPTTTVAGVKKYWVSQVDAGGVESERVQITVTINARPTEVLSAITGTPPSNTTSATAVGINVGTTNQYTYSITPFVNTALQYVWTVPSGVNIVSGQGTNTIVVNYLNVPAGAGAVGSIRVQARNTNGCLGLAKSLAITKALPLAPAAISVFDKNGTAPNTQMSTYSKYMGTTAPITLVATPSATAAAYEWGLPAGVNLDFGGVTPVTTTAVFTAFPFLSPATAPTTQGTKFWEVTYKTYNNVNVNGVSTRIVVSTAVQKIFHSGAYGSTQSQPYLPYGTVITSDKNSILVNFAGVTNPSTTALYLSVRALNGVGLSVTSNTTNADVVANATSIPGLFNATYSETFTAPVAPNTPASSVYTLSGYVAKTAKLKKLTAALPLAPATVKLTNPASATPTAAITNISRFVGTPTVLTVTAGISAAASSYSWELPEGVTQISGGNSNVITVNFQNVAPGAKTLYIGCKAVNGIGSSVTNNGTANPATTSTARLLKLTASLPLAVTTVTGQITGIVAGSSLTYSMSASALANNYVITAPVGAIVTSPSVPANSSNILTTTDLTFTVVYPTPFVSTTASPQTISISSVNGVGASVSSKVLTLRSLSTSRPGAEEQVISLVKETSIYPNPAVDFITIELDAIAEGTLEMAIYNYAGNMVSRVRSIELKEGENTVTEDVSRLEKGIYVVRFVNTANNEVITKKLIKK